MYRFTEEDRKIIEEARKINTNQRAEKRLYALTLRAAGKSTAEVAALAGYKTEYITHLARKYRKNGIEAISGKHYTVNRKNMTKEEEKALLEPFRKKVEQGEKVTVAEIKLYYEQAVGHTIGSSQIYRVLDRLEWQKIVPRRKYTKKASEEDFEAQKNKSET